MKIQYLITLILVCKYTKREAFLTRTLHKAASNYYKKQNVCSRSHRHFYYFLYDSLNSGSSIKISSISFSSSEDNSYEFNKSGRRCSVLRSASFFCHFAIFAWCPLRRTSGTSLPSKTRGFVY